MKKSKHYKYIPIKHIITLAKMFISKNEKKKRGRSPKYSEEYILTLFFMKIARELSYRVLRVECEDLFGKDVPAISTLHYRFKKLDQERLRAMVNFLAFLIERRLKGINKKYLFCDGTGFGFDDTVSLKYRRGIEIREVKGHVKVGLLVAGTPLGDFVIGVRTSPSYGDERKLLLQLLKEVHINGEGYFIADSLYGMSNEVLERIFELGLTPVIPIREGVHTKIRSEVRKRAARIYEELRSVYKQRYRVEQVIAKIKNSYGDKENVKSYDMAEKQVIAKVVLFNYCFLISLIFHFLFATFLYYLAVGRVYFDRKIKIKS